MTKNAMDNASVDQELALPPTLTDSAVAYLDNSDQSMV